MKAFRPQIASYSLVSLLSVSLWGAACNQGKGDDDGAGGDSESSGGASVGGTSSTTGGSAGAGAAAPSDDEKVYVVAKHVSTGDAWTTYLDAASVERLEDLAGFDALTDGIELDGYVIPVVLRGAVYAPDAVAPTITRYDLDESGELIARKTLSFAGEGLTYVSQSQIVMVSDTKAYLFDATSQRVILWNPSKMQLEGSEIDLRNDAFDGFDPWFWPDMARLSSGKLLVPVNYGNEDGPVRASNLVVIDTNEDRVEKFVSDERCQQVHVSVATENGDVYFFPNSGHAEAFYTEVDPPRPPTCSLRVRSGDDEFDPDYVLELGELAGGDETSGGAAQGAFPDGRGGFYFSVVDEERYAEREANGYSYYRLWHYDFEKASEVLGGDFWSGAMSRWTEFEDEAVVLNYGADESGNEYTLVYDGSAEPLSAFQMAGTIEPVARLR